MTKKILILQQRKWALNIGHPLAEELVSKKYKVSAITLKKSTHTIISKYNGTTYDDVFSHDDVMENPSKYLDNNITLQDVCHELGVDSIWPLVNSLRNHVRSYGKKYYYSFKQNSSDEDIVEYVKALYFFCTNVLNRVNPDMIISPNFVSLPHIMLNLLASKRGVAMQGVTDCKIRGINIFSYSYLDDKSELLDRYEALLSNKDKSNKIDIAKKYLEENREQLIQPEYMKRNTVYYSKKNTLISFLKLGKAILRRVIQKNENSLSNLGVTIDNKPILILIRDFFQRETNIINSANRKYYNLEAVGNYVYFPLQFQPEASIDVFAPFFSNQLDAIRQVAMSLPGDLTLVVKDHPAALGFRSHKLLDKLYHIPNVKLIRWDTPSELVLKNAKLVVSPNSTTLMEAAIHRIPAIQLGNLGTTKVLPNVYHFTDIVNLSKKIKDLLSEFMNLDDVKYDRELELFIAAAYDVGWSYNYIGLWEHDDKESKEELHNIYFNEIERKLNES